MEVIKIVMAPVFGKDTECGGAGDRIHVAMSPAEVETAGASFRKLAVNTSSYSNQGEYREFKEFFDEVYGKWEKADRLRQRERERKKDDQREKE